MTMRGRAGSDAELTREILLLTAARAVINSGLRFVYPFLPALARGVGVSTVLLGQVVALRALAGLSGPLFGTLSDRRGRRPVLVTALLLMSLACTLPFARPDLVGLTAALLGIVLAKALFDPALQGRVADRVAYASRGRALAVTELSWAAALLLGAPACGWLIGALGWQGPFLAFALAGLLAALAIWRLTPPRDRLDRGTGATPPTVLPRPTSGEAALESPLALLRDRGPVRAMAGYILCLMVGNELLLVVLGQWLEVGFGLQLGGLGLAAALIGGADLCGELGVASLADRWGKRRLVVLGGLLACLAYLGLPLAARELAGALGLIFLAFVGFEVSYVSALPLATELAPRSRAATMSIVMGATSLGRALGAAAGGPLFAATGLLGSGLAAAALTLLALLSLHRGVREPEAA